MKLYYAPGACSLSPHIILREGGYRFELEKVDLGARVTAAGEDFLKINPKGYVPVLQLDDGQLLTENIAIDEYLADHKQESGLAPKAGTLERYRHIEWLDFIGTEVHKQFGPLFKSGTPDVTRQMQKDQLAMRFDYLAAQLTGRQYLSGEFTVADAYLFTVLRWTAKVGIDMSRWPVLETYMTRVAARPQVQAAMKAEGLIDYVFRLQPRENAHTAGLSSMPASIMKTPAPPKSPRVKPPAPPRSKNPFALNPNFNQQMRKVLGKHYRAKFGVK